MTGRLTLKLVRVGLFREQVLENTMQVLREKTQDFPSLEDVVRYAGSPVFTETLTAFVQAHDPTLTPGEANGRRTDTGMRLIYPLTQVPGTLVFAQVDIEKVTSEAEPPSLEEQAEASVLARTYRKWRGTLNTLKAIRQELENKAGSHDQVFTPEDHNKLQQSIGAIGVLSAVLTDLNAARPINQSVLKV